LCALTLWVSTHSLIHLSPPTPTTTEWSSLPVVCHLLFKDVMFRGQHLNALLVTRWLSVVMLLLWCVCVCVCVCVCLYVNVCCCKCLHRKNNRKMRKHLINVVKAFFKTAFLCDKYRF